MERVLPLAFIKRQLCFFLSFRYEIKKKQTQQVVWQRPLRKIGFP